MADKIIVSSNIASPTLYFQIRTTSAYVWNVTLAAFEVYDESNWGDYDTALARGGTSNIYTADFPAAIVNGAYSIAAFEQTGASPAVTDEVISVGDAFWNGVSLGVINASTHTASDVAAVILSQPANKLVTDSSGYVTSENMRGTDSAYTGTPPTAAAVAVAVWDAILSSHNTANTFGSRNQVAVPSASLSAYMANVTNLDVAVSTLATASSVAALQDITAAEAGVAVWDALTASHLTDDTFGKLAQLVALTSELPAAAPSAASIAVAVWDALASAHTTGGTFGDKLQNKLPSATASDYMANVSSLALDATVTGLAIPTAAAIATAVVGKVVDTTITLGDAVKLIMSESIGAYTAVDGDPAVITYKDAGDNSAVAVSTSLNGTSRTRVLI